MAKPHLAGTSNGRAKLSEDTVKAIYSAEGSYKSLAAQYNVSPALIGRIKRRETWKHLELEQGTDPLSE